jgi:murein DD-endopeptidase MepM/ murein hydrolase activator NlpD
VIRNRLLIFVAGFLLAGAMVYWVFHRSPPGDGIAKVMADGVIAKRGAAASDTAPMDAGAEAPMEAGADDYARLLHRNLTLPIEGAKPHDIEDTFNQARAGGKRHEATDILAPRNTPVHAIGDGVIRKLFLSKPGGLTIYEFDPDEIYCYYYAHLEHYADGIKEGMPVTRGEIIGFVGTSGDAPKDTPHLHFAITRLGPDKHWWQGEYINPYPILEELAKH